jgi:hypothetical protein
MNTPAPSRMISLANNCMSTLQVVDVSINNGPCYPLESTTADLETVPTSNRVHGFRVVILKLCVDYKVEFLGVSAKFFFFRDLAVKSRSRLLIEFSNLGLKSGNNIIVFSSIEIILE